MSGARTQKALQQRKVGLDKPCSVCGQTIYFGYKGPIDGVCGKCTDGRLAKRRLPTRTRAVLVEREGRVRAGWVAILLAFAAGAFAMYLAYPHLPF